MARDPDEISLIIEGERFRHWRDFEITLGLDTYSTVSFTAPFEAEQAEFRRRFRPFSFAPIEVLIGDGEPLFNGSMLTPVPQVDESSKIVWIPGYAKPAVLHDCNPPGDELPWNFQKIGLRAVSDALTKPFDIESEFLGDPGPPFEKVKIDTEETIQRFLVDLAQQRGFVMTDTPEGKLRYWRTGATGNPVVSFEQGIAPLTRVTPTFNPQDCFSEITGYARATKRKAGAKHTERNPFLKSPIRPKSFKLEDTEKGDAPEAARAEMGRMFGNMASWVITDLPGWRDPSGALWKPNTTIKLKAPDAMIYESFELCIRNVLLRRDPAGKTATLELVLPGVFSGKIPERLPWD